MKTFYLLLILSLAYITTQTPISDDIIALSDEFFGNPVVFSDDADLSYDDDDFDLSDYITEETLFTVADKPLTDVLGKIFQDLKAEGLDVDDIEFASGSLPRQSKIMVDGLIPEHLPLVRKNALELDDKNMDDASQEHPQPPKLQRKNAMTSQETEEILQEINQPNDQESEPKLKENSFFNKVVDKVADLPNQDWVDKWVDLIDSINTEKSLEKPPALLNLDTTIDFEEDVPLKEITQHNMNASSEKEGPTESYTAAAALDNPVQDELTTVDEMNFIQVNDKSQNTRGFSVYVFTFLIFVLIAIGMKAAKEFKKRENAHHHHRNEERNSDYIEISTN